MSQLTSTLPRLILGVMALVLVLGAIPAQAAKPNLKPAISLGPLSHREELRATVTAKAKLTRIELRIDNRKVQPWVKAHAGWKYTIRYPLTKLTAGMHTARLKVWNQKNQTTQRHWQFQKLAQLALSANKANVQPGEKVTLTGQGFTPGARIAISMRLANGAAAGTYGTAIADTNGRFSLPVTLARYPDGSLLRPGPIVLLAHTADFNQQASAQLRIVTLSATPMTIQPGDPITLRGEGFAPGSTVILSMALNGAAPTGNFGSAAVDAAGRFLLTAKLTQYPGGAPLQPGALVLVVHDPSMSQRATIQIQVVDRAPAGPSDLRVTSVTKGSTSAEPTRVGVQWRDNSPNETGFRIQATYTRMNGGTDTQVWHVAANATTAQLSFVAGGINPINKACFTVTAFNNQGDSASSNEVCAVL